MNDEDIRLEMTRLENDIVNLKQLVTTKTTDEEYYDLLAIRDEKAKRWKELKSMLND